MFFVSPRYASLLLAILALFSVTGTTLPTAAAQSSFLETATTQDSDTEESTENQTTPLSDFAPDEIRPARGKSYDQGLTITKVSVDGNRLIDDQHIKDEMAMKPGSLYSKRNLQKDLRRIYGMGYFTEKIKAVPIATNNGIHLRIEVEENAPVTGISIEGNSLISDEELQGIFAGQTGMPQNIGQLNESIEKIEKLYAEKGYVLARVNSIADDPDGVINLTVNEGVINSVDYVGNRKTKDFVIERMMATKSGEAYNEKRLSEDLKRIFSTQSFSDVRRVITVSPEDPDKYDVTIELDEKKTGALSLGGGVDTATGLFGSLGFNDPNFRGRGESFNSAFAVGTGIIGRGQSLASAKTYQFDVGWSTPSLHQTNNALSVGAYGRDMASMNVPLGIERRIGTVATWSRPIMSIKNTAFSLGIGGERVSLREGGSNSDLDRLGVLDNDRGRQLTGGTYLSASPTLAYDSRDNRFNPTKGMLTSLSLTGAYGLSSDSYSTISTNIRKYIKLHEGVVLALNAQGGTSALGNMPEFNMFRMGGSYSVRGFREGGLGIGSGFLLGSAELRTKVPMFGKMKKIPFLDTMTTAFFMDAGQVLNQSQLLNDPDYQQDGFGVSIGAGIRINIPGVGPLRVDYALPIAGGNSNYYRNFNFGIGQKF